MTSESDNGNPENIRKKKTRNNSGMLLAIWELFCRFFIASLFTQVYLRVLSDSLNASYLKNNLRQNTSVSILVQERRNSVFYCPYSLAVMYITICAGEKN